MYSILAENAVSIGHSGYSDSEIEIMMFEFKMPYDTTISYLDDITYYCMKDMHNTHMQTPVWAQKYKILNNSCVSHLNYFSNSKYNNQFQGLENETISGITFAWAKKVNIRTCDITIFATENVK